MEWNDVQQKRFDELRLRNLSGALTTEEQAELAAGYACLEQEEDIYLKPVIAQMDVEQAAMREHLEMMQVDNEVLANSLHRQEQFVVGARHWLAVSNPLHTSPNREAMLQEQAAYQAMLPQLLAVYENQYVAVYQGDVVDHDVDKIVLSIRLDESHPDVVVLVRQVTADPDHVLQMPSPRLIRNG